MPVELNHTIVGAVDAETSARWLAEMLGLADPEPAGFFWQVMTANGDGHYLETITRPYGSGG